MITILTILTGITIGYTLTIVLEYVNKNYAKEPQLRIKDYHIHHSLVGIAALILSFFTGGLTLLCAGVGVIIRHTHDEKEFVFISKEPRNEII